MKIRSDNEQKQMPHVGGIVANKKVGPLLKYVLVIMKIHMN